MKSIALLLASTLVATAASAQTVPAVPMPVASSTSTAAPALGGMDAMVDRLMALDTNKDGKLDKAEWLAGGRRERGFQFLDTNKDGFITPAELKEGMERLRSRRMPQN